MQSPEQQRRFSKEWDSLLNHLGTVTKMLVFTEGAATLPWIPLGINCSSASQLPSEPAELLAKNGILGAGRCCFHREQKLRGQLSSFNEEHSRAALSGSPRPVPRSVVSHAPQPREGFADVPVLNTETPSLYRDPWQEPLD